MKSPKYFSTFAALFVISGVLFEGCGPSTNTTSTNTSGGSASVLTANAVSQNYKDGSYTENASYRSPAGTESVTVKFVLASNIVTDVNVSSDHPLTGMSNHFQGLFNTGIQQEVVGKNLNDLSAFSRVNGSSLTSGAFNNAVIQLRTDAKA